MAHDSQDAAARQRDRTDPISCATGVAEYERLHQLLVRDLHTFATFLVDRQGCITTWNEGVRQILGYSEEEFVGHSGAMLFTPEDVARDVPQQELEQAMRDGYAGAVRWHIRKDGSRFYCDGVLTAVLGAERQLLGFTRVMRDATARLAAEQQAAHLTALVASSEDAIVGVTPDRVVMSWNPAAERMFSYTKQEMIGQSLSRLVPAERAAESAELFSRAVAGEPVVAFETVRLTKHGRPLHVSVTLSPIREHSGALTGFSEIFRDTTDRRRAEQMLAAQALELERSNNELQAFAYTASHDLQEPSRTVVSLTQLLARNHSGALGSDADRLIPLILEAANRMSKLVKSLLDYSRVGGDPDMHRVPVDLNETFRVACQTLNFAIQDSEAVVTHEPLPTVLADRDQMHQLVQNLLSNALKYRRRDEAPRVQLQVVRRTGEWLFTLRDQGLGFEPRHAEHIFGIFKRVHGQRYSGTGIGLAICRKIVERHGGRIWAESAGPGQGAAFHFTLPETEVPPDVESGG